MKGAGRKECVRAKVGSSESVFPLQCERDASRHEVVIWPGPGGGAWDAKRRVTKE